MSAHQFPSSLGQIDNLFTLSSAQLDELKTVPALTPPPDVVPDFAARNQRGDVYNILCSILLGIVYVFFSLRMYAKLWIKRTPGFDDGETPIMLSLMLCWLTCPVACALAMVNSLYSTPQYI